MNFDEIQAFEALLLKLKSLYDETQTLSKKNPGDLVNKFKLRFVNSALADANEFLGDDGRPFDDFTSFKDDELPSNSDVVMILGQYISVLNQIRDGNIDQTLGLWYWIIDDKVSNERTGPPSWQK